MNAQWSTTLSRGSRLLLLGLLTLGGVPLAGLAQPVPSAQPAIAAVLPPLQVGDSGPLVSRLQTELTNLGLFAGKIDGRYDLDTAAAVRSLQAQQGLAVDGIAGPQTWRALEAAHRAMALPPPLLTANLVTFTPLVVAPPAPPPPAFWLAMMPLVPIVGGALTCLHRRRQQRGSKAKRPSLPLKPKL